jgi:hypothetical protein
MRNADPLRARSERVKFEIFMAVVNSRLRLKKRTSINSINFHKEKEMADFRKWFLAFAVVALLLGMGTSANAQIGLGVPSFQCTANAAVPPIVRAEGLTELVGDLTLNCNGGTPTLLNQNIPLSNVTIFLSTNVTSRLIGSGGLSEATLMIDEPHAVPGSGNAPVPDQTVQNPPVGSPVQFLCTTPFNSGGQGAACPEKGTFVGIPSPSPYATQPNVFSGVQNSASSVVFLGIPIDAPGTAGTRVIRITNIRANAFQLGVSSTLIPSQITAFIAVNGSQQVTINNPTQTVAFIQVGLHVNGATTILLQCEDQLTGLIGGSGPTSPPQLESIQVFEGFPSSFKRRNIALTADGTTSPAALAQNVPGYPYNTESGFYAPGLFTATPIVGLADTGTKILLRFNNVGAGVSLFVPLTLPLLLADDATQSAPTQPPSPVAPGIPGGQLVLVAADGNGNSGPGFTEATGTGGLASLTFNGTAASATYEVVNSDPNATEHADIPVSIAYISNTSQNLPAPGSSTVNVSFAPLSTDGNASSTDPIPRFGDSSTPLAAFSINLCTCDLLFPFVTNQSGFDTGIALANTSLDPFGTGAQTGTVKLYYFGGTAGGGAAPPPFTTQTVPAGQELIFNLSGGGNFGVPAVPGFEGYIISVANFQYCHAFAFISDVGAQKLAEGYLAIQLDFPFNLQGAGFGFSRTGVNGENEGH